MRNEILCVSVKIARSFKFQMSTLELCEGERRSGKESIDLCYAVRPSLYFTLKSDCAREKNFNCAKLLQLNEYRFTLKNPTKKKKNAPLID